MTKLLTIIIRIVAIDVFTCRSGRGGGTPSSEHCGYSRFFERQFDRFFFFRGEKAAFSHQERVRGDTHRNVVMKPSPTASFVMTQSNLTLQFFIIALNAPAYLNHMNK